jgi:hypothetical protein
MLASTSSCSDGSPRRTSQSIPFGYAPTTNRSPLDPSLQWPAPAGRTTGETGRCRPARRPASRDRRTAARTRPGQRRARGRPGRRAPVDESWGFLRPPRTCGCRDWSFSSSLNQFSDQVLSVELPHSSLQPTSRGT